jgi:uncharacterized membrane protein
MKDNSVGMVVTALLAGALVLLVLAVLVWTLVRLHRSRARVRRDARAATDELRAAVQALLAARLASGELDPATYERLIAQLWGAAGTPPHGGA